MKNQDNHSYDDIINLPNPTSTKHPRMPLSDRAAQFSPFAALTGHEAAIKETARRTDEKLMLSDEVIAEINVKLNLIAETIGTQQRIRITYFVPDNKKAGGAYISCSGCVKKIDEYEHTVVMEDKTVIPIEQISDIEGEMFGDYMAMSYRMEIVEDKEEGGFVVFYPDLPGCITCGETIESAVENAQDAKKAWLEAALEEGIEIHEPVSLGGV